MILFRSAASHHLWLQFSVCKSVSFVQANKMVSLFTGNYLSRNRLRQWDRTFLPIVNTDYWNSKKACIRLIFLSPWLGRLGQDVLSCRFVLKNHSWQTSVKDKPNTKLIWEEHEIKSPGQEQRWIPTITIIRTKIGTTKARMRSIGPNRLTQ